MKRHQVVALLTFAWLVAASAFLNAQKTTGNSFPRQVETIAGVQVIGQVGALPVTTLFTPDQSATYRVSVYATITNRGNRGGGMKAHLQWSDPAGNQATLVGGFCDANQCILSKTVVVFAIANQPITFDVTENGITDSPTYNIYVSAERL